MIQSNLKQRNTLVIGYNGGVGRAFLGVLQSNYSSTKDILKSVDQLFLLDQTPSDFQPQIEQATILKPQAIKTAKDLEDIIKKHNITEVIDLSSVDTVECTRMCEENAVNFLCASVEEWPESDFTPTDKAIARLLPPHRDIFTKQSHLVGSGANPGIVNALVDRAIQDFAKKENVEPTIEALQLKSILITERDTTSEKNADYNNSLFAMTWSPLQCLAEMFEPRSFYTKSGKVFDLNHRPTEKTYRARCGNEFIEGMAIPHEETKTLARKYSNVEFAFLYEIPLAARKAIASRPDKLEVSDWQTRSLFPPTTSEISGYSRVGLLLTSEVYGEMWIGFESLVEKGLAIGSNATQMQVAAGIVAGWKQLGNKKGIHFVEDLNTEDFLKTVEDILGPCICVFDTATKPLSLEERAIF